MSDFIPRWNTVISQNDFHLTVRSFTCKCLHDLELKCVHPRTISSWYSAPGWNRPGGKHHFSSKSCIYHLQVNDQTPIWKSSRDEITHVNRAYDDNYYFYTSFMFHTLHVNRRKRLESIWSRAGLSWYHSHRLRAVFHFSLARTHRLTCY